MASIRKIKKEDNQSLSKIIKSVFIEFDAPKEGTVFSDPTTDELFELFQTKQSVCFVAEESDKVLGSCGIYPTSGLPDKYAELVKFYLAPKARGKGIGKQLFQRAIEAAKEMKYTHLYIESQALFKNALSIYEAFDFNYIDHPLGNSGHHNCGIWMLKNL